MRPIEVAAVCHEANRMLCLGLGDTSQPTWFNAPEWQKSSAIDGVKFHLDNPDASHSASHENWLKHKENDGWTYGETKDADARTHPCMVPFDALPAEQQAKDALFKSVVDSLRPLIKD